MQQLFFHCLLILFLSLSIASADSIELESKNIGRGNPTVIKLFANLQLIGGETVFRFDFNAALLRIIEIQPNIDIPNNEYNLNLNIDYLNPARSNFEISMKAQDAIVSGHIFNIEIEGLSGPDSVGVITPTSILINESEVANLQIKEGIYALGIAVFPAESVNIGQNYPNPFDVSTTVPIIVNIDKNVFFTVYNSSGKFIAKIPNNEQDNLSYELKNHRLEEPEIDGDEFLFEPGRYDLKITFSPERVSSGVYFISMISGSEKYHQKLLYVK